MSRISTADLAVVLHFADAGPWPARIEQIHSSLDIVGGRDQPLRRCSFPHQMEIDPGTTVQLGEITFTPPNAVSNSMRSTAWQATSAPLTTSSEGRSARQRSLALEQRGWNAQPRGGSIGFGTSPPTALVVAALAPTVGNPIGRITNRAHLDGDGPAAKAAVSDQVRKERLWRWCAAHSASTYGRLVTRPRLAS